MQQHRDTGSFFETNREVLAFFFKTVENFSDSKPRLVTRSGLELTDTLQRGEFNKTQAMPCERFIKANL